MYAIKREGTQENIAHQWPGCEPFAKTILRIRDYRYQLPYSNQRP